MIRKSVLSILLLAVLLVQPLAQAGAAPLAQDQSGITSPRDGAVVRGVISIVGTANHPEFWKYEMYYAPGVNPSDQWVFVGTVHETPVDNGQLETWNTTLIPDGVYALRLRVVRRDGNYVEYTVRNINVANTTPTDTPTPEASPTPEFTPTPPPPTSTPEIVQPPTATPRPTPTFLPPTPTPEDKGTLSDVELNADNLQNAFCMGGGAVIGLFGLLAVYFVIRNFVLWLWSLIWDRRRRRDQRI